MPYDASQRTLVAWVSQWWRALLSELIATAMLMILGVGSMIPSGEKVDLTHPALAFGFVVTALITAFGAVSGAHMNPAVTLAAVVHEQIAPLPALAYVFVQIIGAICGFSVLRAIDPMREFAGVTMPGKGQTECSAMLVEAVLTGTLALVAGGVWSAHRADPAAAKHDHTPALKFGLTVAGLVYAGGKLTGASLNPARSLAPAIVLQYWRGQWVYWAGPLLGALVAACLQRYVLLPPPRPRPRPAHAHEDLPLNDKPEP